MEFGTREFAESEVTHPIYVELVDRLNESLVADFIEALMEDAFSIAKQNGGDPESIYKTWVDMYTKFPSNLDESIADFLGI